MNSDNLSTRKYQEDWESKKDQIYFMQTETPEYAVNKHAGVAASKVKYKEDYEKAKGSADYNVLPATENPMLRHLKAVANNVNDRLYKEAYEKAKAKSINYCETPKYKIDNVLKDFSDVKYKEPYIANVLGRYIGTHEDPYQIHCMKVGAMTSDKNYKADYEEEKANCYFPQTLTPEYEVQKKLDKCKDVVYKKPPDQIKFTQAADSPVLVQAQINTKQLSDMNYKAKHEAEKSRCSIPPDTPLLLQSRVNAYNISDNWYKYDWDQSKAKKFDIKVDAIPILAAKAKQKIASDVEYKKGYEMSKGRLVGALSVKDDPRIMHSLKVGKLQNDRLYKEAYEKAKGVSINYCETPQYQVDNTLKNFSGLKYKEPYITNVLGRYIGTFEDPYEAHCRKVGAMKSDKNYKADYEDEKAKCYFPQTITQEYEAIKKLDVCKDSAYKKHPDQIKFTSVPDSLVLRQAQINTKQLSDMNYKAKHEAEKFRCSIPADAPLFLQSRVNAYNISDNWYKYDWDQSKAKKFDIKMDAIPILAAKAKQKIASDVEYKKDYEKGKGKLIGALSVQDDPKILHSLKVGKLQNDRLYKELYEKAKGVSINYCETPQYQVDNTLKNFSGVKYKEPYIANVLGRYIGTFEDPYEAHCMKVGAMKSDKNYKADYEDEKAKCYFPQTITQEYEAMKKLDLCKDSAYKKHPDQIKFTSVPDSLVLRQAQINTKQLSDMNYKAKHEAEKFKCSIPPDAPLFLQSRVNAYNISDNWYKYDWDQSKAKKFDIKMDAIPILAAKAKQKIASDVEYKKGYEKGKGRLIGALSVQDDPKMLHSLKVGKLQNDRLYKEAYEKAKGVSINYCETPQYQVDNTLKNFSGLKYKEPYIANVLGRYIGTFEDPYEAHCRKVGAMKSDKNYKADYEDEKAKCYFPQTITQEYEAIKKLDVCKDHAYKKHPDQIKFTPVTDSLVMVQAQINSKQLSDLNYKAKHEAEKNRCSIPPDAPLFLQSRVNAYNISDNWYKYDWDQSKAKKFDIKMDAIPILAAKAKQKIASDVEYKKGYEQSKGKLIGALSIEDDPKMIHCQKMAKQQSDLLYKKGYEASKTKYTAPLDMIPVVQAKKAQMIVSDTDYRHRIHNYSYPPDSINVELAKKANAILSDNEYKADYNSWMKGCGWIPYGSLDAETAKRTSEYVSEKKYRQHPDTIKFTQIEDHPTVVQAKINQAQRSDVLYKAKNEERIHSYNLPSDAPQFIQAKVNSYNISDTYYKLGLEDLKSRGYDLRSDAIPIRAAKSARKAASDFEYKKAYEQSKGKLIGFQSLQDDPKLVHYMNMAKMQSERDYKKAYEQSKTKYNTPFDMVNVVAAKKAQEIVSNTNYKNLLHNYTLLPDDMNVERSKNMMQIQSDNLYKGDFNNWMKGIGWIPIGSLEAEKAKKAGEALNEKKYRQHPDTIKFTSIVDSPVMVQAKQNALQLSDILYKSSGEEMKHTYNLPADAPQFIQAKYNAANISDNYYKYGYQDLIAKGPNVLGDAIPITQAKASRNIASDYKYKEAYQKTKGKQVGFRNLQDAPMLVHSMNVAKMQSEREYKKDYEKSKTCYHTPVEMVSIQAAKQAQDVASNVNYKNLIHRYTYLPDAMNVELAKNRMQIQSDITYKDDYNNWLRGVGWSPLGSLDMEKVKKAGDALCESKYRQHPDKLKFTSLMDSIPMVLAQQNTKQLSDINYKVEGEKVKHKYHLDPDVPAFIQAKVNAYNISDNFYKADWKRRLAEGYNLKADAIPIVAAKSSRHIASDYKYKESYEKGKGKQIGFLSLQDDPKLVHYMKVAKLQSEREYKKGYESGKTNYNLPLDHFSIVAAKKAQEVVTDTNYKQPLHHYTLLPDAMSMELSRNRMQIQSDNLYKTDFNSWLKGLGWVPIQSLEVENAKNASHILNEQKYRQHPDKLKYTIDMDAMEQVLAKQNAHTMNKRLYIEKWNKDKTDIHVMPDTPEILLSKANQITMSDKIYRSGWDEEKKKGYDLRPDALSIKAAKASRDIASDYKYKLAFEQSKGKQIGFRSLKDDPKLVHYMEVAKMQSEREYKKDYEKSKTRFHIPVDMFSFVAAKKAQEVATDTNYRNIIHSYSALPDSMNLELAKNMMQIQSNNQYKADYDEFMKGIGWIPLGSLEAEKNRKAMDIVSEKKYRQHPDKLKYSILMDSMPMVLATSNAKIMDDHLYKKDWEAEKTQIHITPDIPEILLAKVNAYNISDKIYKHSLEEAKKKGYDLRNDAISIKAAKASREIASDYKYKLGYEQDKGKLVGFRSLQDDPKLVHFMQVAKMQSDREYRKAYEGSKTRYNTPADTVSIMAAKEAQANITNTNYKRLIHKYILLPDALNVELARNMNRVQSDHEYKQDYNEWYKGLGWSPAGSLDIEKSKKATEIASDTKYRQHPSAFPFKKLTDSMDMELAKHNADVMNKRAYINAWEKDKTTIHVMPDTPDIMLAKANKFNYSQKLYKLGWEEMLKKGYDLTTEAISVKAAKASRDIASDYKYKDGYRKQLGHHIGARSIEDDPKLVHSMNVAKMQSEREYKKVFEQLKTKYSTPVDMLSVLGAKNCQKLVSDIDYRNYLHQWTCLPDQNDVIHAKKTYELQSDIAYKSDLEWIKGIGWNPFGSLESEKNKKASEILSERTYRQHPDTIKFTSIPDSMEVVLAKENSKHRSDRLYRETWDKDKTQIHIMPDTPEIVLSRINLVNLSDKLYKLGLEELKRKGYDLPPDAIPIKAAKASREIASEYKYKEAYRKQLGHHVGARSIEDDPKLVHSMNVAKMQSEREYKKVFEQLKTKYSSPVDMLSVLGAKNCQKLVSDIDYRNYLHQWTCLPDQNDVIHAKKTYDLQSDINYKSDLEWLRGIGWSPSGSLEAEKNKRASEILSDHGYRQHPDTFHFTSPIDSLPMALAKHNSEIMNQRMYVDAWNKDKSSIHIMPDTPEILLSQQNKINFSDKLYKLSLEEARKKGYDLRIDAIPIKAAKASRDIASEYKYKEGYRKQLGHHIGARSIEDDPKLVHSMNVGKMQSEREYKKVFEQLKTKYSSPVDMLSVLGAKNCQKLVSDIDYRNYLHQWTCLPDQNDVIHARKAYELQSDNYYKSDLQWLKGIGWVPIGSLDTEKAKKAGEILSEKLYRQPPDKFKFTSVTDSLEILLAKHNAENMNKRLYTEAWDKDKTQIHIMPDTPEITLARQNKINYSESLYKLSLEEAKKKGYDLRIDAIPIQSAKASRIIASDYKYKEGYRKQLGHHIGARSIEDDPKMLHSINVAKMQSEREYKKVFEKLKTKYSSPVDMLSILGAKNCQKLVSDIDYRNYLHQWTCLPDQNDVIHARKAYDLQSDNFYKADLEWIKGIGWVPIGSLAVEHAKKAGEILSEKTYRQPPESFKFTSVTDSLEMELAKHNAETMNKRLYTEAWNTDKQTIHVMPDTPEIVLAKFNKLNYSQKLYRLAMEEAKKDGYDLRLDAIPIQAAKASRAIASDYKYKEGYRKQLGHHIGARSVEDDPKIMHSINVAKMQSEREYKKVFEKLKTKYSSPVDMLSILGAKNCQKLVSDIDYRNYLHQWTCLPDQNDVIHARKAYDLQSDNCYKADLEWIKGIGWVPIGSLAVEHAKKAGEILSEKTYRQPPESFKFTSVTDSLEMELARQNAETMNKRLYTEAWDTDKCTIHVMPDTPEIVLAKFNKLNYSQKLYRLAMEEAKKDGYDLRLDAIPIQAAKASRAIASDYKYKEGYRKQLGHHIGARSVEDDPKIMHSINVAKMQSEREYKKVFEKLKTKYNSPVDMLSILGAKNCQKLVSDIDYRNYLHQWTCLPDQNDVIQARKAYDLQSDALYKSDLEWLKGIGWVPLGSLNVEHVKRAGEILSENKYRQPPSQMKFTCITDAWDVELAKHNAEMMNKRLYTEAWDADKIKINVMPDTPEILLAKANSANISHKLYVQGWEDTKKKGYDLRTDAIPIKAAKASRDIASDYKYKEAHEKQKGHYIGVQRLKDDPKLVWFAHAGQIRSDLEYKKNFEKCKANIHCPVDMLSILDAKNCQKLVSNVDYRKHLHEWICLPDQNDVIQAKKAYDLQSDNVYKSDLEWLRGIGWIPEGSVEVQRVKNAQDLLNERMYRQRPDSLKFTAIVDSPEVVLAKANALMQSGALYREVWDKEKTQYTLPIDIPEIVLSKANSVNYSKKHYQLGLEEMKKKGYDLRLDAIEIQQAKASRNIASEYKYKEGYRKQVGHHVGFRDIYDDPKLVLAIRVAKLQSEREYKKYFEKFKTKFNSPVDMLSILLAKKCQKLVSDIDYRRYLHEWICLPDQNDVIQAKKAYELQSDNLYKSDLEWLRGIGWMPEGSVDVVRVKKAQDLVNDRLYKQRPDALKFTSIPDPPPVILAKINAQQISERLYRETWDNEKAQINIPLDTPEILLSKMNAVNVSHKHYTGAWDEAKAKGYDFKVDALSFKHAKSSREIASEYKYKQTYERQKGHYIGTPSVKEDPKLSWAARVMKMQNDRLYKQAYHNSKAKITIPYEMVAIQAAKQGQAIASDVDYHRYLHEWSCLPDQNDVIQAKKAYELQSDNLYKSDLEWLRGIGWMPEGSVDVVRVKRAQDLINERLYKLRPDALKFTSIPDPPPVVLAKVNAQQISEHLYREAWDKEKAQINIPLDTPEILLSKMNAVNASHKHYTGAWDEAKAKGYDFKVDALSFKHAKSSREIASEYKYKQTYESQKGHYIGTPSVKEDPKLSWAARVMKMQNDRLYKQAYHSSKARITIPYEMVAIQAAKQGQAIASDIDYHHYLHQWSCLPDQNDVIQAKKAYELQSDNLYKSDLEWLRGIGWMPEGSVDVVRVKRAQDLVNERLYKLRPDALKFTSIPDPPPVVLAKVNAQQISENLYREAWDKEKAQINIPLDTPEILLSKMNAVNASHKHYTGAWDEAKAKGYDFKVDALSFKHAKSSREIASEYKYKQTYESQKGHYIGTPSVKEDPKLSWAARVMKMQNDRLYKQAYHSSKAKITIPYEMVAIQAAKQGQAIASDIDYHHYLHQWSCLPDQNDVIQAKKAYELQSDNLYKSDLEWLRGIGWMPEGSVDVVRVKRAQDLINERLYKLRPDALKFTSIPDPPPVVLAKVNAQQISENLYREAWDKEKAQINIPLGTPSMLLSKMNAVNVSNKHYTGAWDEAKAKGYDFKVDALSFKHAKSSREIASEYKYKQTYERQKGHYIGTPSVKEDPKLSWAARVMKMQNDRLYKQAYHSSKAKITIPYEMVAIQAAKQGQAIASDIDYHRYLHQWSCLPDQNDVIQAKKAYELQSDAVYKSDLEWLRGIGWIPSGSPIVNRVKFAQEILSDNVYRTPADRLKFTNIVDTPDILLAKTNAEQISIPKYREVWDKDKVMIHVMPDTPEIMLSKANAINVSNKLYRDSWDDVKKYIDYRSDAIPIKRAKASREIASDYKYKEGYRKQVGHHIGFRNIYDDPKLVLAIRVAKLQSEREYKKHFEKFKTKFNSPVDMLSILLAKKCQKLVSDIDYRRYLHEWICLPDQNDVIQAKKAYELQSDAIYKSDLEWLRGIGWMPSDSVSVNHVKHAQALINERLYRTKAHSLPFTPVDDRVDYITAKQGGEILSDIKYHQEWNDIKAIYTLTDTPRLQAVKKAARILNEHLYKDSWEKHKATGYSLPPDSVPLRHAKHSDNVQSELKYKADYVKQRGHYVGVNNMREDPKLVWFEHAGKIQNDRLYKESYHKTKSHVHIPPDIRSVIAAKDCQHLVSEIPYRNYLHEWTCHPDQNDCIQAKKAYDLQSDNLYKSDLEWLRGCGWIPLDSVDHRRVKNAQELINKRIYTKEAIDNFDHFTSVEDTPDVVLAKANSIMQSDVKYKETFNLQKGQYIGSDDTPALSHSRQMIKLYSDYVYKDAWESKKAYGYTLPPDYIPIVGAKHADYINSLLKYKALYEKLKGHYLAGKHIQDFPSVLHSLAFQKIRSALAYRKNYEDTKAHIHIPSDMINHVLAKKCQYILSDLEYRTHLHQWNCSPEENDVVLARKAQEILSDVIYKDDLTWLKGIGCYVWDTPQILHAKKSYDLQSQLIYTKQGKDNLPNYGVVMDTPVYVTAVQSGINASELKYKEQYHKTKDKYTTVLKTADHDRIQNLKHLFSNNVYKKMWEKIKSLTYKLPPDAVPFVRARQLKYNASIVKYREEYDKFKALYTIPRGVQDDPNTARCLRVGKLNIDRLYRDVYEKNKAKIHIVPDMVGIVTAKKTQKKISEIDYRVHLHQWASIPDPHANILARKVNNQLSDFVYKDDLNWLKGIGCFVWDTPEILHAKHAYDLRNLHKYKAEAEKMKSKYSVVTHTPLYVQNVLSGKNLSEAVYRHNYVHHIKGKYTPTDKTVDLERANRAYKIQSEPLYRNAGLRALPTGYKLPPDTPGFKHAKHAHYIGSDIKYKEIYEHVKGTGYNFGPKAVPFVQTRKVNKILNERMYREVYHKNKDKIHTTPDTPHNRQVKINQEAFSDLIYKTDFFKMQGHLISLPFTPQTIHNRYVGEITSDIKYKSDLQWLKGLGCFLYDTPDMVRSRHLRKLWSHYVYTDAAKKMQDKYSVVLDTPVYRKNQELKTHLSEIVYRAAGKEQKSKYTSILDTPDFNRAKRGQKLQSQYLYVELATKERPHHHAGDQTPALKLAKHVKDFASEKKYRALYDKLKDKYVTVPDTPILIRAKKSYLNASDLRYKETFERAKGKYHTVKDALDIVYHRKVTDDISKVKYKEKYMSELGFWRSIPDLPEHYHHRAVTDAISTVKYKEDLTWLKGIGCYAWDTPDLVLAEKNKALYSPYQYKETFERTKSKFKYVADSPINRHFKYATRLMDAKLYKSEYEKKKDKYSLVVDDPKTLLAKWGGELSSQYKYKRLYEKQKDKFTSVVDTPEHLRTTKVNKLISDILYKLEYQKAKPKGYTSIHDTPMILHVRKVMDRISELKYKELYEQNKAHCNVVPDSVHIKAAKQAYKVNSNLDYKKKYEATKAHWHWTMDRPDFIQAAKTSLQQSDYEYKLDREYLKGCKLSVTDDKNTVLALQNAILASDLKYKEKHNKERGSIHPVPDTPQILLAKMVSSLVSENKYKEHVKKHLPHGSFTKLPETLDTIRVKKVTSNVSETNYKKRFQKEKGKSDYSIMVEPPDVKHAMDVAKKQSTIEYKKDAKSQLHYTTVADRPDIMKATQVSHLVSDIEYKAKQDAGVGVTMLGRPDIELAKEVSKLTSQIKYKERFDKEKGKKPQYDLKESKIYKTLKDAHHIASEIKYKADLKKLHKPVTDMSESLAMNHVLNTSHLASTVKYKEKYEKERGKPMLDFETPTYITAKESQQMQSEKEYKKDYEESIKGRNLTGLEVTPSLLHVRYATKIASEKEYRRDLEEGVKGKGLTILEETPDLLRAKNATYILNEKEYKRALEMEIKGRGLTDHALETPDYMRAKNATDIASELKYKHSAEMEKANYTTVVDTPEIIHAHHVKNFSSKKKYKEDAEKTMPYYVSVLETPEIQRVRENQKNFSMLQYQHDLQDSKGKVTVVNETPEILRVKENQKNFSVVLYKDTVGTGTAIEKTPEIQRIRKTTDAISTIKYKEHIGKGTPISDLPEVKRVKEAQKHISSVLYKESLGKGTPTSMTPEMERAKRNQENISSILYSDSFRKQVQGKAPFVLDTPEMRRVRESQRHISTVKYHEDFEKTKGSFTPVVTDPITERVKKNMQDFSDINYRGIQRRVVEMEQKRIDQDQEMNNLTGLRVWRTNPGSVFDYDPAEDNIQSRSLHLLAVQAQRRSREHSRSASALSLSGGDEKSEHSEAADQHLSYYSNGGFLPTTTTVGYKHAKTVELPQQRSSSVGTQQTTVSSIPSHPSTAGKTYRAVYDYTAADADEVSFKDGDAIVNVQAVDEGWMYGTVQRTGKTGMLPANYVEAV
ncbi:nebulin isoform X40 [Crotalus tigris]|uniref:nebulin isoform X40 n=1 Tax=Crotalus tigris TaxID=88082 RepID=UPI00192F82BA|nr:nebulin isoform X40 [Crotalus tigris]